MMINPKQYKLLNRISKTNLLEYTNLTESELSIIYFLASQKLIIYKSDPENDTRASKRKFCQITQEGYAAIYLFKVERFHFWIPSVIAFIALIVSILSLSTTAPDVWKNILKVLSFLA